MKWRSSVLLVGLALAACSNEAEDAVRKGMLDPDATQFRDVGRCSGDRDVWRGEANGKNTFGAYVGFKPFFYSAGVVSFSESPDFAVWLDRCYKDLKSSATPVPAPSSPVAASTLAPSPPAGTPMHGDYPPEGVEGPGKPNLAEPASCWGDYCPCERGPDFGGADKFLCDRLNAGLPVDQ